MAVPKATTGPQPGVPYATGGKPQKIAGAKTVTVKAHTRRGAPKPNALQRAGLSKGQQSYWQNKLPGASAKTILRARAKQQYNHNPQAFGPNTNLTPIQANQQAAAAANLKYGPQIQQLNQAIGEVPGWYQAYQQQVAQLQTNAQNAYTGAATQIGQSQQQIAGQQQTNQQGALQAMGQDAANRGANVDAGLAASSSQFQAGLNALSQSDLSRLQGVNQSQQQYLGNLGQIQSAAGQQNLTNLRSQLAQVLSNKGDYTTQQKAAIVGDAQKYGIELGTLGISQQNANTSAKNANTTAAIAGSTITKNTTSASKDAAALNYFSKHGYWPPTGPPSPSAKLDQAKLNFFNQHGYLPTTGPAKGKNGKGGSASFTPTQQRKNMMSFRSALRWAKGHNPTPGEEGQLVAALLHPKGGTKPKTVTVHDPTTGKIIYNPDGTPRTKTVGSGSGGGLGISDPLLARVVADFAIFGGVRSVATQKAFLKQYGIKVRLKVPSSRGRNTNERPT